MLVAMAIMLVIMLMMATIFRQTNVAWSTGFREVERSMEGRVALNMISEDLSDALANDILQCDISGNSLSFWTQNRADEDVRAVRRVTYTYAGDGITRSVAQSPAGSPLGTSGGSQSDTLIDEVTDFSVTVAPGDYSNSLPAWVELTLQLEQSDQNASVKVWSNGRDKMPDKALDLPLDSSDDDIRSWKVRTP
jgi:hypothetical protein